MNRHASARRIDGDLAAIGTLIGDPVRAEMLLALLDGRERPAADLAAYAHASRSSASGHLAKLVAGGLIQSRRAGRNRLFRLASSEVGHALESLAVLAPRTPIVALSQNLALGRLVAARSCYDHLAGRLGVAVTDALCASGALALDGPAYTVSAEGATLLGAFGVDVERARAARRKFAHPCLDWTERRPHLAGALGHAMLAAFLAADWVRRHERDRSLLVTHAGRRALRERLGIAP